VCVGPRTEYGREVACLGARHTMEDEGAEVAEGSRDSRVEA
jgi:hypothetical protein